MLAELSTVKIITQALVIDSGSDKLFKNRRVKAKPAQSADFEN
jgi:hypothetical protein